jgi:dephospho-CoA kinase
MEAFMVNNNKYVIVLNGYPRSGKDEFVRIVSESYECYDHSTIDKVKFIASEMGWDGNKTKESRKMLSELKKFYIKWFDGPFQDILKMINELKRYSERKILFIHIREPEEIKRLQEYCKLDKSLNFCTILVKRPGLEETDNDNDSDNNINDFDYDYEIINRQLYKYKKDVLDLIKNILHKYK